MNLDGYIIAPVQQRDVQIAEYTPDVFEMMPGVFSVGNKEYSVNISAMRYKLFRRSRVCACCGIIGTRVFLDYSKDLTDDMGCPSYHINLYAENRDKDSGKRFLTLMVKGHIIPPSKGGEDTLDNLQTMCYHCNSLKMESDDLPLETLKKLLFPAYRDYRSTIALNRAKEKLAPHYDKIHKNANAIPKIMEAFKMVKPEKIPELESKIEMLKTQTAQLKAIVQEAELKAQISGIVPDKMGE